MGEIDERAVAIVAPEPLRCSAVTVPTSSPATNVDEPAGPVSSWSPGLRSALGSSGVSGVPVGAGPGRQRQLAAAHVAHPDA